MTILRDACTATSSGKLSTVSDGDEMLTYVEITERLIRVRTKPAVHSRDRGDKKKCKLAMRKSLFPHVPPYMTFGNANSTLPPEITKHLFWWQGKKQSAGIIHKTVLKSGFSVTSDPREEWCGTWCNQLTSSRLGNKSRHFRKINQFPGSDQLSNKISLWKNLRRMKEAYGEESFDLMPLSFVLPEERIELRKLIEKHGGKWIVKPPDCCAGYGISIVTESYEIPEYGSFVAQRYVSKPRLIDGIKFDIRLYILLTSVNPLRIYVYKDGLVRLATIKYLNDRSSLRERFMHLTNTSINKLSPNYTPNDDPEQAKGNMWSLNCLWKYLDSTGNVDTMAIWSKIKDIAIKTLISVESTLAAEQKRKSASSTYNFYQLFGFDVLLDEEHRPWLLEVNDCPSMEPNTPLCEIVKGRLVRDYLTLVGFHVPNVLTAKELIILKNVCGESNPCYNRKLYAIAVPDGNGSLNRNRYLNTILNNLTPDDARVLIRYEDEIARTGSFEKIFPTCDTYHYFNYFERIRYYDALLDAWENEYTRDRSKGIERLRRLCRKNYHLR